MKRGDMRMIFMAAGAAIGAGAMALLDPGRGARRRAWIKDKMSRGANISARVIDKKARHIRNEARGAVAEQRARMREGYVADDILEERVKAQIGHVLSHRSVGLYVHDGHVIVEGPVLRGERQKLAGRLNATRGVQSYDLRVKEHDTDEGLPSPQGVSSFPRRSA